MQYEAKTPAEYIANLDTDWRKEKLEQVRELIKKYGTHLNEGIEYKMLAYGHSEKNIFHLNAQRSYVSLYVGNINKVDNAKELLKDFDKGKGCIRIKKRINIPDTGLEQFIKSTIEQWEKGGDTNC